MSKHIEFFSRLFFPHFLNFNLISNFSTWICAHCRNFRRGFPVSPQPPRERAAGSHALGGLGACVCILHAGTLCVHSSQHRGADRREGQVETLGPVKATALWTRSVCGLCPWRGLSRACVFLGMADAQASDKPPLPSPAIHRGQVYALDR